MILRGQSLDPLLHIRIVALHGVPFSPMITLSARLEGNKAREALDIVAVGGMTISGTVNFNELNLVAKLSLHVLDNSVPVRHELNAVAALRHEEVDNYQCVGTE